MGHSTGDDNSLAGQVLSRLDDLFGHMERRFEQIDQRFERIEQRLDRIEKRLDEHDKRFEQLEQRMERQETLTRHVEDMCAELFQAITNTNERLDKLYEEVREMREEQSGKRKHLAFIETKVWEHEREIYLLREQVDKYGKEES
ncbi:hypothetical protein ACQKK5_25175 [Brevibacillus panacihumi]|uniref:hypothetical protein n=1 Tax=Brevibacillus panacihumi TaxID=497735 RepID=UPI003D03ADFC